MKDPYKADPREKVMRNTLIREYRRLRPDIPMAHIGKLFSISKQRVFSIIKAGNHHD